MTHSPSDSSVLPGFPDLLEPLLHLPGSAGYETHRQGWNLAVHQQPLAVVRPRDVDELPEAVAAVTARGLAAHARATGHHAAAHGDLSERVLLDLSGLRSVEVDGAAGVATVEAGARWEDVVPVAAKAGLVAHHGTSGSVGVVGYLLGGGLGWHARRRGLACRDLLGFDLVRPDGGVVRIDDHHAPELLWAARGGGQVPGVIARARVRLHPIEPLIAGRWVWDVDRVEEVVAAWVAWTADLDASGCTALTTVLRVAGFPPDAPLPHGLAGRRVVIVDGVLTPQAAETSADELLAPLRRLAPEIDTWGSARPEDLLDLHLDPRHPVPAHDRGAVLDGLDQAAAAAVAALARSDEAPTLLEVRHLGGACAETVDAAGGSLGGSHLLHAIAVGPDPRDAAARIGRVLTGLEPWSTGRTYLNFASSPEDRRRALTPDAHERLATFAAPAAPSPVR